MSRCPSPEELSAYLDGELEPAAHAAVTLHLASCGEDAARVAAQQRVDGALRRAFTAAPEDARARQLAALVGSGAAGRQRRRRTGMAAAAAAAVLLTLAAAGGGWLVRGGPAGAPADLADLARDAAAAYPVRALATAGPGGATAALLAEQLGRHVDVPDLGRFGFHLAGAALLATEHGPAVEVAYEDGQGRRISCLFRHRPVAGDEALRLAERDGLAIAYGADGDLAYTISARAGTPGFEAMARVLDDGVAE